MPKMTWMLRCSVLAGRSMPFNHSHSFGSVYHINRGRLPNSYVRDFSYHFDQMTDRTNLGRSGLLCVVAFHLCFNK